MKILGLPPGFFLLIIIALAIVGSIIALLVEVINKNKKTETTPIATGTESGAHTSNKKGSFGWAVLGFFFMPIGFILYLAWRNAKPSAAKSAGVGALVGVIACVALTLIGSFASLVM
jgi:hypothetical protein